MSEIHLTGQSGRDSKMYGTKRVYFTVSLSFCVLECAHSHVSRQIIDYISNGLSRFSSFYIGVDCWVWWLTLSGYVTAGVISHCLHRNNVVQNGNSSLAQRRPRILSATLFFVRGRYETFSTV